jgi:hypothetical protein
MQSMQARPADPCAHSLSDYGATDGEGGGVGGDGFECCG